MLTRLATPVAMLGLLVMQPTASASTEPAALYTEPAVKVQLSHKPLEIDADGTVDVVGWLKCSSQLYTFEYAADVTQSAASGSEFLSGASLPCDGSRHRFVISVAPDAGVFSEGRSDISIYFGLYDTSAGTDVSASDSVSVRLRDR